MKTKLVSISKKTIAMILAILMLLSVLMLQTVVKVNAGGGSTSGDWHLYNSIRGQWDNTSSALKLSRGDNGNDYYTLFYLTPQNGDIYWRFWSKSDNNTLGARSSDVDVNGGTDDAHHNGIWGGGYSWKFSTSTLGDSAFYKVWVHLDPDGGNTGNSGNTYYSGWTYVTSEAMTDYSTTITTKKGSTTTTTFTAGDTVSLSASASNGVGTASYSYEYKLSSASNWTTVSGTSFVPSTSGTYNVRVTATDGGVITSGNSKNAISPRTATKETTITVNPNETLYSVTKKKNVNGTTSTIESVNVGSNEGTDLTFNKYETANNVRYKLVSFSKTGNVTLSHQNPSAGTVHAVATSASATVTANYTAEADYRQLYFKKPSGWTSDLKAYLWKSSDDSIKNANYGGITIPNDAYQAATNARQDSYGVCDYVGSLSIQNGSNNDIYYYYKTYCSDYDRLIFNNNNSTTDKTDDLPIDTASLSSSNNIEGTYAENSMYYDISDKKWHPLPAALYDVTINATGNVTSTVNSTGATTATGTVSAASAAVNSSTTVDVTITAPSGYTFASTPVSTTGGAVATLKTNTSNTKKTYTISATANGTVTPNFVETSHTITVTRRLYDRNGTLKSSSNVSTSLTAGVSSYASISQPAATSGDYSWKQYTFGTGINNYNNYTSTTQQAITVKANLSGIYTVYEDYTETLYTPTVSANYSARGSVTWQSGANSQIGNVTYIKLTAENNSGYDFDFWEITPASGKSVIIEKTDGTGTTTISSATGSTAPTAGTIRTNASLKFKMNGAATIKAHFKTVDFSISTVWDTTYGTYSDSNTKESTDTSGNTKGSGSVGQVFQIRVTPASGYEIDKITFATSGTDNNGRPYAVPTTGANTSTGESTATATTSGSTLIYQYKLGAGSAKATITLKAKTPTISLFKIEGETSDTSFVYKDMLTNTRVDLFYKQPVKIQAQVDSFARAGFEITKASTTYASATNLPNSSMNPYQLLDGSGTLTPSTTVGGYEEYPITMTATNAPAGVKAANDTKTVTIRIYYNSAQKAYLKMKNLHTNTVQETDGSYYKDNAPWSAFNSQRDSVYNTYTTNGEWNKWPVYNPNPSDITTIQSNCNKFINAYKALQSEAKTTTVYVLSQYSRTQSQVVSIYNTSNGTDADFNHFKQYHYFLDSVYNDEVTENIYSKGENELEHHIMRYEGVVSNNRLTDSGAKYYLYSFTYAGHVKASIYVAGSTTATSITTTSLTGTVTGLSEFKDYYINAYDTTKPSSSITTASPYNDLNITKPNNDKIKVKNGKALNRLEIMGANYLNLTKGSSLTTAAPSIDTSISSFTVNGTTLDNDTATYTFNTPGKQIIKIKLKYTYGEDAVSGGGATFETGEKTFYLYVTYNKIDVYIDMNDNVGNPSLNFTYTEGGSSHNLPVDMSLVNGSESIYKATLDLEKLKNDYSISYINSSDVPQDITIAGIKVDGVTKQSNVIIKTDAYLSGTAWYKANSTSLTGFIPISYSNVRTTFRAVNTDGEYLKDAISSVSGTGIITDEFDGIYDVFYASIDNAANYTFGYNVKAKAKQKITYDSKTYYFDGWYRMPSSEGVATTTVNDEITIDDLDMTNDSLRGDYFYDKSSDYNINTAPEPENDYTYVAVYKQSGATDIRVKLNYKFNDFNTADGNYIYDANKDRVSETYSKIVKIPVGNGQSYKDYNDVYSKINEIAGAKMPNIVSNYFDYSYDSTEHPATIDDEESSASAYYIEADVQLTETAHEYRIIVLNSSGDLIQEKTGYYQQPVILSTTVSDPVWQVKYGNNQNQIVATGETFKTRFTASGFETNGESGDCQIFTVLSKTNESVAGKSVITNSTTEVYYDGATEKVKHNFYINDYCGEGKLIGGGVIYATVDENGNYRQTAAGNNLGNVTNRKNYINGILNGTYSKEYKAQTIDNTGFRYLPFDGNEDVYRYSSLLSAYQYTFTAQNNNSESYSGQKLRVFSFMVYNNNGTTTIVPSEGYAEVTRYVNTTS